MLSFTCLGVFTICKADGGTARWVRTRVHGQSFLLNQIRKMVGLALAVYRGTAPENAVYRALDPCLDFSTPMAPELGLFLCECKFATYNERFGNDRDRLDLGDWEVDVEKFKQVRKLPWLLHAHELSAHGTRGLTIALKPLESPFRSKNAAFARGRCSLGKQAELLWYVQEHIYPALVKRDEAEKVNYQWLQTVTDDRYMFSTWREATPVRKLKRPRPREPVPDADDADQ
jgi:hypothetical protein